MTFITELHIKECSKVLDNYELTKPFIYHDNQIDVTIIVPTNFCTDFASIPKWLRWLIDDDEYGVRGPAVIHDYLYSKQNLNQSLSRRQADQILRNAMKDRKCKAWKVATVYAGVRAFGWLYFRR